MKDEKKTKKQLIEELADIRQLAAELDVKESERKQSIMNRIAEKCTEMCFRLSSRLWKAHMEP
jgi:hypothetical protein